MRADFAESPVSDEDFRGRGILDFADVSAGRSTPSGPLKIAAVGAHNPLPTRFRSGKTMLAKRIPSIAPAL